MQKSRSVFQGYSNPLLGILRRHNGDGNENVKKSNRLNGQNNNSSGAACLFVHFFGVAARLRLEKKSPISRFMEDVNEQRRKFLSLSELGYN